MRRCHERAARFDDQPCFGGFWGPAIIGWTKTATGNLHLGLLIVAAVACCGAVLLVANRLPSEARR